MAACEQRHDRLSDEVAQGHAWHAEHHWRRERLAAIDAELDDLGHIDLRRIPLPERSPSRERHQSLTAELEACLGQSVQVIADARHVPAPSAERLAEITLPPLPGRNVGPGIDLGL